MNETLEGFDLIERLRELFLCYLVWKFYRMAPFFFFFSGKNRTYFVIIAIGLCCGEWSFGFEVLANVFALAVYFPLFVVSIFHVILVSVKSNACNSVFLFLGVLM